MNNNTDLRREVIPRWRDLKRTAILGELNSGTLHNHVLNEMPQISLEFKYLEWERNNSLSIAIDLINSAYAAGQFEYAIKPAKFIYENEISVGEALNRIILIILGKEKNEIKFDLDINLIRAEISDMKKKLNFNAKNAVSWLNLGRLYSAVGELKLAERAINNALILSPNNRYIIRSAVNFFHQTKNYHNALKIFKKAESLIYDPWLLSAEIATCGLINRTSENIRRGKTLLNSDKFSAFDTSELASSIATQEISSGSNKKAKKLFAKSLVSPNENTLAQVAWMQEKKHILNNVEIKSYNRIPYNFEAISKLNKMSHDWMSSLNYLSKWIKDQPFNLDAYIEGSYIASVGLADYSQSINYALGGLSLFKNDFLLNNNLIFAYLKSDMLQEATEVIGKLNEPDGDELRITYLATLGLFSYKVGNIDEGRYLYDKSITLSKKYGNTYKTSLASIYQAQEEIGINDDMSNTIITKALSFVEKSDIEKLDGVSVELGRLKERLKDNM